MQAAGRHDRFTQWSTEHRGIFLRISRAYADDRQDQADLYQEMLLQVWQSLGSFSEQSRPSTWIYRVCLNTALNWRRNELRRRSRFENDDTLPDVVAPGLRPGAAHENAELLDQLYDAIHQLSDSDRSLILLALDGLSYADIAEITGMTPNHVGVALSRARANLTQNLKEVSHELE